MARISDNEIRDIVRRQAVARHQRQVTSRMRQVAISTRANRVV